MLCMPAEHDPELHPAPPACVYLLCVIDMSGKKAARVTKARGNGMPTWKMGFREREDRVGSYTASLEKRECRSPSIKRVVQL